MRFFYSFICFTLLSISNLAISADLADKPTLNVYTYDSFTFDFDPSDGEQFFTDIKNAMKYPVKGQIGDTYNTLESLVFEHAI